MDHFRAGRIVAALCMLVAMIAGCGGGDPAGSGTLKSTATVVVDGSSTVFRISRAAKEAFRAALGEKNPEWLVVVDNHGTGGGFGRYLRNEVDIVDASRPARPDEEAKAREQGIDWTRFVVGYDGITLVVNPANEFVKTLSVEQVKAIWEPSSRVQTWKDVDSSWPDRRIVFYSPDNDSGTFEIFTEAIAGKARGQREGVQQSSDDNTLVMGVAGDADALGYFGFAYYAANRDKLRAVAIRREPKGPGVLPSLETIADKSYAPLSRPLFIYVKKSAARRSEVAVFLRFYLANIDQISAKAGYAPPTPEDKASNEEALAGLLPSDKGTPAPVANGE